MISSHISDRLSEASWVWRGLVEVFRRWSFLFLVKLRWRKNTSVIAKISDFFLHREVCSRFKCAQVWESHRGV
jgi:hypothetical protein